MLLISANADFSKFHPAKTSAEKTLDMILKKQITEDREFYSFLTDFSNLQNKNEQHEYYKFFTKRFVRKMRMIEESLCDAATRMQPDMKCTIDVNPITGSADDDYLYVKIIAKEQEKQMHEVDWENVKNNLKSDIFLYKSYGKSESEIFIEQVWAIDKLQLTLFKMLKEDGNWKIDDATLKRL